MNALNACGSNAAGGATGTVKSIGMVFLNNRVRAKIYPHENFDSFVKRVRLVRLTIALALCNSWNWDRICHWDAASRETWQGGWSCTLLAIHGSALNQGEFPPKRYELPRKDNIKANNDFECTDQARPRERGAILACEPVPHEWLAIAASGLFRGGPGGASHDPWRIYYSLSDLTPYWHILPDSIHQAQDWLGDKRGA